MTKIVNSFNDLLQGISVLKSVIADLDDYRMGVISISIDNCGDRGVVVHVYNDNLFTQVFPNHKSIPERFNDYGFSHRLEAEINGMKIIALRSVEREVV